MSQFDCDVVLIGAGLVGCSLLAALADSPIRFVVLEKSFPQLDPQKKDDRPISLAYGSVKILKNIHVWEAIKDGACSMSSVHVSEQGRFGQLRFDARDYGVDALGYVVPFYALQKALYEKAKSNTNVTWIEVDDIESIEADEKKACVQASIKGEPRAWTSQLVIGADGTASRSRECLAISATKEDHQEQAVIANITLETRHQAIAFERFTAQGVIALLPLWEPLRYRLVWTLSHAQAQTVCEWSEETWLHHIASVFEGYIPSIKNIAMTAQFPLQTTIADQQILPGAMLLGNSAHTLYPLAAQGFNLGLRDVSACVQVLKEAKQKKRPLGKLSVLETYLSWRESDQKKIANMTKSMAHIFGLQVPLLGELRGLGLMGTQLLPPLKKRLAKRLMGLAGRLPDLVRQGE